MNYKWIGAILIISGCSGAGLSIANKYRKEETSLNQLMSVLQFMESELEYKLTPLPELCRSASRGARGSLREVIQNVSREMDRQSESDAESCMCAAIRKTGNIPRSLSNLLLQLGQTLGRFDLPGQLRGIQAVKVSCERELKRCEERREVRLRSYQTLGVCAGIALAILFA